MFYGDIANTEILPQTPAAPMWSARGPD